ncbi:DUF1653 domain-containing protein [uncultured Sphaerochaeta sp.]|uniref:DUF1653 domain-containing protein n=1 Tax=uncultured Sphaerochaeta sp. TaxID=886478 RepID=UPI002A0A6825|nr:DUF1653 domain-containing protein [uncultured Sphaerochaeta sp.]
MVKPEVERKRIEKGLYRHFKGGLYEVQDTVIDSESLATMVLYRPVGSKSLWVRPYDMFVSLVERDGIMQKRFTFVQSQTENGTTS